MVASLGSQPTPSPRSIPSPVQPVSTIGPAPQRAASGRLPVAARAVVARPLSTAQVEAIRGAMRVFVEDDLARGVDETRRTYCDGCERARPTAGFIQYDRYALCNACATEYEVARARGLVATPGQYIRDKRFGEGDSYTL